MQNFSDATYKNILDYMLSLVPDTYDKRDTSPIQTSLGPAATCLRLLSEPRPCAETGVRPDSLRRFAGSSGSAGRYHPQAASAAVKVGIFDCEVPIGARFSTINGTESINFVVISTITEGSAYRLQAEMPVISATDTPAPFCRLIPLKD